MAHKFTIKQDAKGEYRAYFKYNGESIFWTEGYSSKAGAVNAIESVKKQRPRRPHRRRIRAPRRRSARLIDSGARAPYAGT